MNHIRALFGRVEKKEKKKRKFQFSLLQNFKKKKKNLPIPPFFTQPSTRYMMRLNIEIVASFKSNQIVLLLFLSIIIFHLQDYNCLLNLRYCDYLRNLKQ